MIIDTLLHDYIMETRIFDLKKVYEITLTT